MSLKLTESQSPIFVRGGGRVVILFGRVRHFVRVWVELKILLSVVTAYITDSLLAETKKLVNVKKMALNLVGFNLFGVPSRNDAQMQENKILGKN